MRRFEDEAVGNCRRAGVLEAGIFRVVVRFAAKQLHGGAALAHVLREPHEKSATAEREDDRPAIRQPAQNLGCDVLVAIGPQRVKVRMDEVTAVLARDGRGTAQQFTSSTGDFDQLDAEGLQLFIFSRRDGLRHNADHAEAESLRTDCRTEGRISHRGHDELSQTPFPNEVLEKMHGPANLETAGRGEELALRVDFALREKISKSNQRDCEGRDHRLSSAASELIPGFYPRTGRAGKRQRHELQRRHSTRVAKPARGGLISSIIGVRQCQRLPLRNNLVFARRAYAESVMQRSPGLPGFIGQPWVGIRGGINPEWVVQSVPLEPIIR